MLRDFPVPAMAFDAQKQIRENTIELQDFLKDLRQWEHRVKEKDKKLKSQSEHEEVQPSKGEMPTTASKVQPVELNQRIRPESMSTTAASHTYNYYHNKWEKFDLEAALREADGGDASESSGQKVTGKKAQGSPNVPIQTGGKSQSDSFRSYPKVNQRLGDLGTVDNLPSASQSSEAFQDANSEKELGNKHFKEKMFVQAVESYSQSIALQPSAVAYANRAMAHIKIRRFKEAEIDCTEAIALDDRYVKAYSRRGTARKELGKFLAAVEDSEFALRLEPDNKELKQQYLEAKSLCEKSGVKLPERKVSLPIEEIRTDGGKLDDKSENNLKSMHSGGEKLISMSGDGSGVPGVPSLKTKPAVLSDQSAVNNDKALASLQTAAAQAAAARAARAVTAAPKTFYEFESMWKSFSGAPRSRAELIKAVNPLYLPSLFKDNLSPKLLSEIIRTLEWVFPENASLTVEILENLTKVRRFNMTVMCLTSKEKSELRELWERVFIEGEQAGKESNVLSELKQKYQL